MGKNFFKGAIKFIRRIKKIIVMKANNAEWIKSILIPALRSKPITLMGMPNFIRLLDIFSEAEDLKLPTK